MKWQDITAGMYQQIEAINKQGIPDIDRVLYTACVVFGKTEFEIDNENPAKVVKMMAKMQRIFESPFNPKTVDRIGDYDINYDVSRITLGQYIEITFFIGRGPIDNAHYILASMSGRWRKKKLLSDHRARADYFLTQPVEQVIGAVNLIQENYILFNSQYQELFGVDPDVVGNVQGNEFNKRYGWVFSATQVAHHEGVSLETAYGLPIRHAFNDLLFIKSKGKYELEQLRTSKKEL